MTAVRQLTLLIENLSTILPVNSGINKPLMLPKLVIITAPIINPTGQLSFLNRKNNGFCAFMLLPLQFLSYLL